MGRIMLLSQRLLLDNGSGSSMAGAAAARLGQYSLLSGQRNAGQR